MTFNGIYTALITPFRNGKIDVAAFERLIENQIANGVTGIAPMGTTGESPTLNMEEHVEVIRLAAKFVAGRCQILAGTGANSTNEAIELTLAAEQAGATSSLQVAPYYNKPSQEGLFQHFQAIANATKLPIMLYSVPGRSVIEIGVETAVRLAAACPNILGIKEAGGSVERVNQLVEALPADFSVLSGDDPLTLAFMVCGAVGLVSVASNIIPREMGQLVSLCNEGNYTEAAKLHRSLYPLLKGLMSVDVNPVPIKLAAAQLGYCTPEFRLPLVPSPEPTQQAIRLLLQQYSLL